MEIVIAWNITGTLYQIGEKMPSEAELLEIGKILLPYSGNDRFVYFNINKECTKVYCTMVADNGDVEITSVDLKEGQ